MSPEEVEILHSVVDGLKTALALLAAAGGGQGRGARLLTPTEEAILAAVGREWAKADDIARRVDPGTTEASNQLRGVLNLMVEAGLLENATGRGYRRLER